MVGDFHALGRFGELVFADADGKLPQAPGPGKTPLAKLAAQMVGKTGAAPAPMGPPDRKASAAAKGGDVHEKK